MERSEISEKALEIYAENGERISDILEELEKLVPRSERHIAEALTGELEKRMFFADYLCDVHGATSDTKVDESRLVWDYDEFVKCVNVALMLE